MDILFLLCLRPFVIATVKAIRQGIDAGAAEHSMKALLIALAEDTLGGLPNVDGK